MIITYTNNFLTVDMKCFLKLNELWFFDVHCRYDISHCRFTILWRSRL